MKRLQRLLRQSEFQLFAFCLLFMLINWPFLAISARDGLVSLFRYLYALWALLVLFLFLIQKNLKDDPDRNRDQGGP
jgi:hypothetical protein